MNDREFKLYVGGLAKDFSNEEDELTLRYFQLFNSLYDSVLFSYYYIDNFLEWQSLVSDRLDKIDIMIDSGAFSVWKDGKSEIKIQKYIEFINNFEVEKFRSVIFVSLDKIPGTRKTPATVSGLDVAARESFENYLFIKNECNVDVLPVYHLGENINWLKRLIDFGTDYIGLGGLARGVSTSAKLRWLDSVFYYLSNTDIKVHGFGITSSKLVLRYHWYSVDSVTPRTDSVYGDIVIFDEDSVKFRKLYIYGMKSNSKINEKDARFIEDYFGIDSIDELKNYWCRCYFSLREWMKFRDYIRRKHGDHKESKFQQSFEF